MAGTYWLYGRLAQLVEQLLYTEKAGGSSPSAPTTKETATWQKPSGGF